MSKYNSEVSYNFSNSKLAVFKIIPPFSCCPVPIFYVFSKLTKDGHLGGLTTQQIEKYSKLFFKSGVAATAKEEWIEFDNGIPTEYDLIKVQKFIDNDNVMFKLQNFKTSNT